MKFNKINFEDTDKKYWNSEIEKISGPKHLYTWQNLSYYSAYENVNNHSFLVFDDKKKLVGVFPLAINYKNNLKPEFSFGNDCCPYPLISSNLSISKYFEIKEYYFEQIRNLKKKNFSNKIQLLSHPLFNDKNQISFSKNQFAFLKYTQSYKVQNLLVQNLNCSLDEIFKGFSKSRKRDIKLIEKKDLIFEGITSENNINEIRKYMEKFKELHFQVSGKKTRPDKTWEIMLNQIINDEGYLFTLKKGTENISFLYSGKYKNYSWCWSQVNKPEFEKEFMPRHYIEWEVMKFLKRKKIQYYEIGSLFYKDSDSNYSTKELSISSFVEKFGGELFPKAYSYHEI